MKVSLVCIAKNEDHYIQEWVDYHLKIGFDDVFIYQNDWRCEIDNPNVHLMNLDGDEKQTVAYNDFIVNNHSKYEWVAFFDVDEFLTLKKHNNVKEFLSDYQSYPGVGINWVIFGNNGIETVEDNNYSVLKRFTKRQNGVDQHIKTIVNLKHNPKVTMGVHNPHNDIVDSRYKTIYGPFNPNGNDDIVQLNHYFCKTKEEFALKCERGRSDLKSHIRTMDEYEPSNRNEYEDFNALNFFLKQD